MPLTPSVTSLETFFEDSKHQLSDEEEKILTLKSSVSSGMWVEGVERSLNKKTVEFEGEEVSLYLKWGERLLAEKMVTLGKKGTRQKVIISHTFTEADNYTITTLIEPQPDEFSKDDKDDEKKI